MSLLPPPQQSNQEVLVDLSMEDDRASCLGHEQHDNKIKNKTMHYLGCLHFQCRAKFYANLDEREKKNIEEEKVRTKRIRAVLEKDKDTKKLMAEVTESHRKWNESRPKEGMTTQQKTDNNNLCCSDCYLNPEVAVTAPSNISTEPPTEPSTASYSHSHSPNAWELGLKASMIYFKNGELINSETPGVLGVFPNQKISIYDLLFKKGPDNPLTKECPEGTWRYFHLPANNMSWVEQAIARYYNEDMLNPQTVSREKLEKSKTYTVLKPEFWSGQQHRSGKPGSRTDIVHSRYMRPRCEIIPNGLSSGLTPNNMVLYMPYLHWDTDSRRRHMAKAMHLKIDGHGENANRNDSKSQDRNPLRHLADVVTRKYKFSKRTSTNLSQNDQQSNQKSSKSMLKMFLMKARELMDIIDCFEDTEMLKAYLHEVPPLHPRRTLDQSHYWTLKSTERRDRDQVVYRATKPKNKLHVPPDYTKLCQKLPQEKRCPECKEFSTNMKEYISAVPRVVMVDQLWMWILDGNTIITSFPRRWGRNKPDPSGVHKSLRIRLKDSSNEFGSIYDLALTIVDQCSRMFFDRTRTADLQPQVNDLFEDAISGVTTKGTAAYEWFWDYTQYVSTRYLVNDRSRSKTDVTDIHRSLFDINPQGRLIREIHDIIDELQIMRGIKDDQLRVTKSFHNRVARIKTPYVRGAKNTIKDSATKENNDAVVRRRLSKMDEPARKHTASTLNHVNEVIESLKLSLQEYDQLHQSAKQTHEALTSLLALKQQQAGLFHAREAVNQAAETLKQGKSIMVFTVVTITFLPLSFCASVFGMNIPNYKDGLLDLQSELEIMFLSPLGIIIIISCYLAFASVRSLLGLFYEVVIFVPSWFYMRLYPTLHNYESRFTESAMGKRTQWKEARTLQMQTMMTEVLVSERKKEEEDEKRTSGCEDNGVIGRSRRRGGRVESIDTELGYLPPQRPVNGVSS